MTDRGYLQIQAIQLRQLLEAASNNPILAPQLKQRLSRIEEQLENESDTSVPSSSTILPRAAIFLRGAGIQGERGITPSLAGEALIQYEKMYIKQTLHDQRQVARSAGRRRRQRGSAKPSLLFTGTPRGSFGLEFIPDHEHDKPVDDIQSQPLQKVADALFRVGTSDDLSDRIIDDIPPGVLKPMKRFFNVLAQHRAELRLAVAGIPARNIREDQIQHASEQLEREWSEEELTVRGTFRGLTRESAVFDLVTENEDLITGTVADELSEEDYDRIDALTNHVCVATIQKTTVTPIHGAARLKFTLIDARPEDS